MQSQRKFSSSFSPLAACFAALLVCGMARADEKDGKTVASGKEPAITEPAVSPFSLESNLDVSGVARSSFEDGKAIGKVDSLDAAFSAIAAYQMKDGPLFRFGLEFERHIFGLPSGAPLPDKLQAFHLTLGADFQLGQAWLVRFEIQPGFYGDDAGIRGNDFTFPMILGASYFVSSDLQLVAGVSYNPNRKYPVLPGVGFRWKVSADWVIDAVLPTPRIEYNLSKSLTLYAGADLRGDTFRVSGDFGSGHGIPKLNGAVVDYTEIRVGAGATWKISNNVTLEIESGAVLVDEFDFDRADVRYRSLQTPPYGGISLKTTF